MMSIIKFSNYIGCIILLGFFIYSCNHSKKKEHELKVYNDILAELVNVDYGLVPAPPPPGNKMDSIIYQRKLKAYQERIDTLHKVLFVKDSLISLRSNNYEEIYNLLKVRGDVFFDFLNKYMDLKEEPAKSFDVSEINIDEIRLIPRAIVARDSINPSIFSSSDIILGQIVISRILFDNDYQKGVLMYSFICRKECGFEQYVFVEKKNGKWIIVDRITNWII